jgi:hypothetical protein
MKHLWCSLLLVLAGKGHATQCDNVVVIDSSSSEPSRHDERRQRRRRRLGTATTTEGMWNKRENGVVTIPVYIPREGEKSFNETTYELIMDSLEELSMNSHAVAFRPWRCDDVDYVIFKNAKKACATTVGKVGGLRNRVFLSVVWYLTLGALTIFAAGGTSRNLAGESMLLEKKYTTRNATRAGI